MTVTKAQLRELFDGGQPNEYEFMAAYVLAELDGGWPDGAHAITSEIAPPVTLERIVHLAFDMKERGLRQPITLYENKVLLGRTRFGVCELLGVPPRFVRFDGDQQAAHGQVVSDEAARHHPEKSQRAMSAVLAWAKQPTAKVRYRRSVDHYGKLYGVSPRLCEDAKKLLPYPDKVQEVMAGKRRVRAALQDVENRQARERVRQAARGGKLPRGADIITGDFRDVMAAMPDKSIDLIFTDPPYHRKHLHLYGDLARLAGRVLKPGGHLIVYVGDYILPDALNLLRQEPMRYVSIFHLLMAGRQHALMYTRAVNVRCKTLVWLRRGTSTWSGGGMIDNLIESPERDKTLHPWQQSPDEAEYIIGELTRAGAVILDPMLGSGSTLVGALRVGDRRAIGIEIVPKEARNAKGRLVMEGEGEE